jgi:small subunit ribosomal protein S8
MTTSDPISDFLARIRNAALIGRKQVSLPHSKLKESMANLLAEEGYLENVSVKGEGVKKALSVDVVYDEEDKPKLKGSKRISKLSRRIYIGHGDMKPVKFGHGQLVVSTPKGLMTDSTARKEKVGGEAVFEIW